MKSIVCRGRRNSDKNDHMHNGIFTFIVILSPAQVSSKIDKLLQQPGFQTLANKDCIHYMIFCLKILKIKY